MGVLDGRCAIVTGAARGIGRGIALALGKEGARLVLIDLLERELMATAEELRATGVVDTATVVESVSDQRVVDETVALAEQEFGGVDILINNAQASRPGLSFVDHEDRDLEICLQSGVWGTFRMMRACHPKMKGRGGSIVNLASPAGTHGLQGFAAYAAAKEAIRGLTKVAATEWGPDGITVNCICPSAETEASAAFDAANPGFREAQTMQRAIRRNGHVESDIGRTVVFLVGPDSTFITGMTVMANGGSTIYP